MTILKSDYNMLSIIFPDNLKRIYYKIIEHNLYLIYELPKTSVYSEIHGCKFASGDVYLTAKSIRAIKKICNSNTYAVQHLQDIHKEVAEVAQIKVSLNDKIYRWNDKWRLLN